MSNHSSKNTIAALTGLRFIAAFYVFLFHIHIRWPLTDVRFLSRILEQGAVGMSLFFILSGFVLAFRYADGKTDFKTFLVNRFARIYPTYALLALLTIPWIGLNIEGSGFGAYFTGALRGFCLIIANIFILEGWFPQMFSHWNDGGAWSISVEAFCYILCPFILARIAAFDSKKILWLMLCCYVLCIFPGLVAKSFPNDPYNPIFYSMPIFRLPEFIIGICTCLLYRKNRFKKQALPLLYAGIVFLFVYLGLFGKSMPVYIGHAWIVVPVTSFSLLVMAYQKGFLARLLASRPLVWLGETSYSFYCFQALLILLLIDHHDQLISIAPVFRNNALLCFAAFLVLVCVSSINYSMIERPARRKIKARFLKRMDNPEAARGIAS